MPLAPAHDSTVTSCTGDMLVDGMVTLITHRRLRSTAAPYSIACCDTGGALFVADFNNSLVRKVTVSGVVTTIAFIGFPRGIAVVPAGDVLYVGENGNFRVFRVTTAGGVASTYVRAGGFGSTDGDAFTAANHTIISGVATDSSGLVFTSEVFANKIRRVGVSSALVVTASPAVVTGSALTLAVAPVTSLSASTLYFFRSVINTLGVLTYGNIFTFTTGAAGSSAAAVQLPVASSVGDTSTTLGATVSASASSTVVASQFEVSTVATRFETSTDTLSIGSNSWVRCHLHSLVMCSIGTLRGGLTVSPVLPFARRLHLAGHRV